MTEFEEYLRGTFEINNGVENDVDTLVRIHAPELLKLAKKELTKDAVDGEVKTLYRHIVYVESVGFDSGSIDENKQEVFAGDKVKVIIIKE